MKDEQNITIKIANLPPFPLTIKREEEETIRMAERGVNQLLERWTDRFAKRAPIEVTAMVAFQFARYYYASVATAESVDAELEKFERKLDVLLRASQ